MNLSSNYKRITPTTFTYHSLHDNEVLKWDTYLSWRILHYLSFALGGICFCIGSYYYYIPHADDSSLLSAVLYVIGSGGFLFVDVLEFITYTEVEKRVLRINIAMSMCGSFMYLIGSIGYLPSVYSITSYIGIYGFIIGSIVLGFSQFWKIARIVSESNDFYSSNTFTAFHVECNACLGAWFFFIGTIMYNHGPLDGTFYIWTISAWMVGSIFFFIGSLFIGYRHFVLDL